MTITRREFLIGSTAAAFLLASPIAHGQDEAKAATDAAAHWLAFVDKGDYAASWSEASAFFRMHVTQAQWTAQAKAAREPLGKLLTRETPATQLASTLPGAPDGRYAVSRYESQYEHKAQAVETVTMMIDAGTWRLAGYFIR
jgi:hypothetical protein